MKYYDLVKESINFLRHTIITDINNNYNLFIMKMKNYKKDNLGCTDVSNYPKVTLEDITDPEKIMLKGFYII